MKPFVSHRAHLDELEAAARLRGLRARAGVDFASNDYLGLAGSSALRQAVVEALDRGVPVGSGGSRLLRGVGDRPYVYFAHSYYVPVVDYAAATCQYAEPFTAVLEHENVFGVQFHPEKSGPLGLQIVKNFIEL